MAGWSAVVPGVDGASRSFAESLSRLLGARLCSVKWKSFPDGEEYVRIEGCIGRGDNAVVVQTMARPQSSSLVYSMLLADAALNMGARRLALVAPYMAFARQDRVFLSGEPVSVRTVMKALYASGYDVMVTVEIHKEESLRFFPGRAASIYPYLKLAEAAGVRCPGHVVVAPDRGALPRVLKLAEALGCRAGYMEKERDRVTGEVRLKAVNVDPRGSRAVIVDDIISTGGTMALAASSLRSLGATGVIALVAHYLGLEGVSSKLRSSGVDGVFAANTLPPVDEGYVNYVDVSSLVADALSSI